MKEDYKVVSLVFDRKNPSYHNDMEYNLMFLKQQRYYFEAVVKHRGYISLEEMKKALGFWTTVEDLRFANVFEDWNGLCQEYIMDFEVFKDVIVIQFVVKPI